MTQGGAPPRTILLEVVGRNNQPLNGATIEQYVNGAKIATTTMGDRAIRFDVSPPDATVRFVARYQGAEHSGEPTAEGVARIKFEEVSVRDASPSVPGWFPIAGAVFAAFTVLSLFFLIIQPQAIPEGNRIPFDIWVAFCLAASASFVGGSASAHGRLPLPFVSDAPIQFSALGGVAIFIVSLLVLVNVYR